MTLDTDFYRQVMGHFATGVTVVTAKGKGGVAGLTVNAFCSLSLEPPLILVCVDLQSATLPTLRESGAFAVNILTTEQEELSRCFATSSEERYEHFCHARYESAATGSPILSDSLGFVDARVVAEYPGGDHVIFVGEVVALGMGQHMIFANAEDQLRATINQKNGATSEVQKNPLAYYCGKYRHLAPDYQQPTIPARRRQEDVITTQ